MKFQHYKEPTGSKRKSTLDQIIWAVPYIIVAVWVIRRTIVLIILLFTGITPKFSPNG